MRNVQALLYRLNELEGARAAMGEAPWIVESRLWGFGVQGSAGLDLKLVVRVRVEVLFMREKFGAEKLNAFFSLASCHRFHGAVGPCCETF